MQRWKRKGFNFEIEAELLTDDNIEALAEETDSAIIQQTHQETGEGIRGLNLTTPDGRRRANPGVYVAKVGGGYFNVNPVVFERLYEPVEEMPEPEKPNDPIFRRVMRKII